MVWSECAHLFLSPKTLTFFYHMNHSKYLYLWVLALFIHIIPFKRCSYHWDSLKKGHSFVDSKTSISFSSVCNVFNVVSLNDAGLSKCCWTQVQQLKLFYTPSWLLEATTWVLLITKYPPPRLHPSAKQRKLPSSQCIELFFLCVTLFMNKQFWQLVGCMISISIKEDFNRLNWTIGYLPIR